MKPNAVEQLKEKGIKPSQQRIAILQLMMDSPVRHLTAEAIYTALKGKMPTLSLATVYNTLSLFLDHDLVLEIRGHGRKSCYESYASEHGHFYCRGCDQVFDIPTHDMHENKALAGFCVDERNVYYRGLCPACQARAANAKNAN